MRQQVLLISKACTLQTQALRLTHGCRHQVWQGLTRRQAIKRCRKWPCRAQVGEPQAMSNVPSHLSP